MVRRPPHPVARLAWMATLAIAACLLPWIAVAQETQVELDRTQIALDESVQMRIAVSDVQTVDIGVPETEDFLIVGTRTSTSMTITNGRRSVTTERSYRLQPTRTGTLSTGRVRLRTSAGVTRTEEYLVTVYDAGQRPPASPGNVARPSTPGTGATVRPARPGAPPPAADAADAVDRPPALPPPLSPDLYRAMTPPANPSEPFLVTMVNRDRATVGEPLVVDYLVALPLDVFDADVPDYEEPSFGTAWFRDIADRRRNLARGNEVLRLDDGRTVRLRFLTSFLVIPLEPGPFTVPPLRIVLAARGMRGGITRHPIESPPAVVDVQPPPADERPPGWLGGNVGHFSIRASADRTRLRVGESAIISVVVEGIGHAPEIRIPNVSPVNGLRALDASTQSDVEFQRGGWIHSRVRRRTPVVATEEGTHTLPPVTFVTWDPWAERWRTLQSDPIVITVEGRAPTADSGDERDYLAAGAWVDDLPAPRVLGTPTPRTAFWHGAWYVPATAIPPLGVALVLLGAGLRRVRRPPTAVERASELRTRLLERLQATSPESLPNPGTLATDLRAWASLDVGTPLTGARTAEVAGLCAGAWGADRAQMFAELLERLELARYAAGSLDASLADEVSAWLRAREAA